MVRTEVRGPARLPEGSPACTDLKCWRAGRSFTERVPVKGPGVAVFLLSPCHTSVPSPVPLGASPVFCVPGLACVMCCPWASAPAASRRPVPFFCTHVRPLRSLTQGYTHAAPVRTESALCPCVSCDHTVVVPEGLGGRAAPRFPGTAHEGLHEPGTPFREFLIRVGPGSGSSAFRSSEGRLLWALWVCALQGKCTGWEAACEVAFQCQRRFKVWERLSLG